MPPNSKKIAFIALDQKRDQQDSLQAKMSKRERRKYVAKLVSLSLIRRRVMLRYYH